MREVDLKKIIGIEGVAKYFYSSPEFVRLIVEAPDQIVFYKELKIPKKNFKTHNKFRVVYKGIQQIAQLQKNIATVVGQNVSFPVYVQGFVKGQSTFTNASQHLARKWLLKADIQNFFDSITVDQVHQVFVTLGCNKDTANILSRVCTLNGVLRQGLHTSPILSNLVVKGMDEELLELAQQHDAIYTRYGDDVAISSNSTLPTKEEILSIIKKHHFVMNEDKFHIIKRGQAQYVTGLSVFDSVSPRVPKRMKRRLRMHLYYIKKFGLSEHFKRLGIPDFAEHYFYNRLKGTLDYIHAIEPRLALKMYPLLPSLSAEDKARIESVVQAMKAGVDV